MNPTTETIPSANSTGAPYVAGNFAPLRSEVTCFGLEVIGHVPEELTGRFLRIGPNPIDELDRVRLVRHHWFAGSGMAHGLRLRAGKAEWFRSRFVLDRDAARVLSRKPIPGPAEGTRDGNVNTNLMNVGGKLCAVVEAGSIPVELDYELASVRRTDFDGTLEAGFTGHPHFDPITGEHHALAYEPFQPVRYISVDRDGRATTKARIELPHIPLIHDMAFTQSFIVVPDFPVTFQPELSHTDFPWLWDERRDSRIGLLPRNGDVSRIQWFEAPRCFAFHFANAYDDGDLTIIDLAKHPRMFFTDQNGPNEGAPILVRWTLHRPSGRLTETVVDDRGDEFLRINGRYSGQAYRYVYSAHWGNDVTFGSGDEARHAPPDDRGPRLWPWPHDIGAGLRAEARERPPRTKAGSCPMSMTRNATSATSSSSMPRTSSGNRSRRSVCLFACRTAFHGGWAPDRITVIE